MHFSPPDWPIYSFCTSATCLANWLDAPSYFPTASSFLSLPFLLLPLPFLQTHLLVSYLDSIPLSSPSLLSLIPHTAWPSTSALPPHQGRHCSLAGPSPLTSPPRPTTPASRHWQPPGAAQVHPILSWEHLPISANTSGFITVLDTPLVSNGRLKPGRGGNLSDEIFLHHNLDMAPRST